MRVRRIRLTLPARMRDRAATDARVIAEAAVVALAERNRPVGPVTIHGAKRPVHRLAADVAAHIAPNPRTRGR